MVCWSPSLWLMASSCAAASSGLLGPAAECGLSRFGRLGRQVPSPPLGRPAEAQIRDVEELAEVHGESEIRRGGVRKEKAGIFRGDARLERLVIELAHAVHERQVLT